MSSSNEGNIGLDAPFQSVFAGTDVPLTDDPPGCNSPPFASLDDDDDDDADVGGIDLTGATISQEWAVLPSHADRGKFIDLIFCR